MAEESEQAATGGQANPPPSESVASQIKDMTAALWESHERVKIILLCVALVAVVAPPLTLRSS
jgi:hypothetical protein